MFYNEFSLLLVKPFLNLNTLFIFNNFQQNIHILIIFTKNTIFSFIRK